MTVLSLSWQMLVFNNSYHRYMKQENGVRTRGSKVRGEPLNTHLEACRNVVFLNFPMFAPSLSGQMFRLFGLKWRETGVSAPQSHGGM